MMAHGYSQSSLAFHKQPAGGLGSKVEDERAFISQSQPWGINTNVNCHHRKKEDSQQSLIPASFLSKCLVKGRPKDLGIQMS